MVHVNQLKTFITVIEEGSLSAAAQKLALTQPAVSQHIQALENYFDVPLFNNRRGRGLEVSTIGKFVYEKAKQLLQTHEEIETAIFKKIMSTKNQINIAAGPIMSDYVIPHLIAFFKKDHPALDIFLQSSETELIVKGVLEYNFDLGFIGAKVEHPRLNIQKWIKDELVLIVPPSHDFAQRQEGICAKTLLDQPVIWLKGITGIQKTLTEKFRKVNIDFSKIKPVMEATSIASLLTSVEAGLGITIVSKWAAKKAIDLQKVKVVTITDVSLTRYLYVITRKTQNPHPAVAQFLKYTMLFREKNNLLI